MHIFRKSFTSLLCVLALFSFTAAAVSAQNFPDLTGDAQSKAVASSISSKRSKVGWKAYADAALFASQTGGAARVRISNDQITATIESGIDQIASETRGRSKRMVAEYILTYMHKNWLRNYYETQTRLDTIFATGRYNCVSSAVLYVIMARGLGLDAFGAMTIDHAFARVSIDGVSYDVETTNPFGFEPGRQQEFQDRFSGATGFIYVSPADYADRIDITAPQLISLILENRIVEAENRNQYETALVLAVNKAALLSQQTGINSSEFFVKPQEDMRLYVYNYGVALLNTSREALLLQWIEYAANFFPDEARREELMQKAVNNLVVKDLKAGRVADARKRLNNYKNQLTKNSYERINAGVLDAEILQKITTMRTTQDADKALSLISDAEGTLEEKRLKELRVFAVLKEANRLNELGLYRDASVFLTQAIKNYGKDARLTDALSMVNDNRVSQYHNTFADFFNSGDYRSASAAINNAIRDFPADPRLRDDKALLDEVWR